MPLTHFICPDKETISIGDCLSHCRMGQRCLTLPTLRFIAINERPWTGQPSTTRLLNGTMLEYLRVTSEYAVDPTDRAYSLLGTTHHSKLASLASNVDISEQTAQGTQVTGTPDLLEVDEEDPTGYILTDYKTYGSYKVARLLGLEKYSYEHPTEVYKRGGRWGKAGSPKKVTTFYPDPNKVENFEESMQLNHYRLLYESQGYKVNRLQLQVTVRDGGVQVARERGVDKPIYLIPIPRLEDSYIQEFFNSRRDLLLHHINNKVLPNPCDDRESWGGRRCKDYCEVAKACPQGQYLLRQKLEEK